MHAGRQGVADLTHLHCKLGVFPLVGVRIERAASQVGLQVVEDDFVSRDDHPTRQTHEPPVLNVDSTVWICGGK